MKLFIQKMFFSKGDKIKTSIGIPATMNDALVELMEKTGRRSVNDVMIYLLDVVLVDCVKSGLISPPKGEEKNFLGSSFDEDSKGQAS